MEGKELEEVDKRLIQIQKSTRTLIPVFVPIHDRLRRRFRWYYFWHVNPYSKVVHWLTFIFIVLGVSLAVLSSLFVYPAGIEAATVGVNPTSDSSPLEWKVVPGGSEHYAVVSDDVGGNYIWDNYPDQDDWFNTASISNVFKITQVQVTFRTKYANTLGWKPSGSHRIWGNIKMGGASQTSKNWQPTNVMADTIKTWTGTWDTSNKDLDLGAITCDVGTCGAGPWASGDNWYQQRVTKISGTVTYEKGPTAGAATVQSDRRINVTWTDNSTTEDYFKIYRNSTYLTTDTASPFTNTGLDPGTNYYYRVTAYDTAGPYESDYTQTPTRTTSSHEQTRYRIGKDDGTTPTNHTWYAGENTSYTLAKGTSFRARIQKKNTGGSVSLPPSLFYATSLGGTYNPVPPAAAPPCGSNHVCINDGTASDGASFSPGLTSPGGTAVDGYYEETGPGSQGSVTMNTDNYTEYEWNVRLTTNATPGQTYYFRVYFQSQDAFNTYTNTLQVTTQSIPAAPTNAYLDTITNSSMVLHWTDNANPPNNEDDFHIERSTNGSDWNEIGTASADSISYSGSGMSGLSPNTRYWYQVRAHNASGYSGYAEAPAKYTRPNQPTSQTASGDWDSTDNYHVGVSWSAGTGGANHYHVRSSSDGYASLKHDASGTSYTETDLSANTSYTYRIWAVNADNLESSSYAEASDTTPPNAPTGLTHTGNTPNTITWDWNDVTEATSYKVFAGTHSDGETTQVTGCTNVTESTCTATGLDVDTQYTVHVHAVNANGTGADSSTASAYTSANQPGAPTLTAGSQQITIVINQNGNPAATPYAIACDAAGTTYLNYTTNNCGTIADTSDYWRTYANWGGASGFTDTGLNVNQEYTYSVKARNGDKDETSLSTSSSKFTEANTPGGPTVAALSWDASYGNAISVTIAVNGNPANTELAIACDNTGTKWLDGSDGSCDTYADPPDNTNYWKTKANWETGTTNYLKNLPADTDYTLVTRARNGDKVNTSNSSNSNTVKTAPAQIANLTHTTNTTSSITWSWDANAVAPDGYKVYEYSAGSCTSTEKGSVVHPNTSVEEGSLSVNTQYSRCARAYRGSITGQFSTSTSAYTSIEPVSGITWGTITSSTIQLSPSSTPSNLTAGFSGIKYCNTTLNPDECSSWQQNTDPWTSDDSGNGLAINTQYHFTVDSRNGDGDFASPAAEDDKYTKAVVTGIPTVEGNYDETNNYYVSVTINLGSDPSWTNVVLTPDDGTNWLQGDGTINTSKVWKTKAQWEAGSTNIYKDLAPNTEYSFKVLAKNGEDVEVGSLSGAGSDTTPPAAPTNLGATDLTTISARTTWDGVAGPAPTYTVSYGTNAAATNLGTTTTTDIYKTLSSLTPLQTYYFKTKAANTHGTGAWSTPPNPDFITTGASKLLVALPGQSFIDGTGVTRSPTDQIAGQEFEYTAYSTDNGHWLDNTYTGIITSTSSDESGHLPDPTPMTAGQTTLEFTPKTTGDQTLVVTGTTGTSSPFTVLPGPCSATNSTVTADPTYLDVLNKSTIVIVLKDAYGNVVPGHTVSVVSRHPKDTVTFFADSNVSDENGVVVAYLGTSVPHTATVTVRCVTDDVELADKPKITFFYGSPEPVAKIVAKDREVVETAVIFDGQGSLGNLTSYFWDFKDGFSGTSVTESHTYSTTGSYNVSLKVTDVYGRSDSAIHKIDIVPPPPVITNIERAENDLKIYGTTTVPNGKITLYIEPEMIVLTTTADPFGSWTIVYPIDPEELPLGSHAAYATVTDENDMTSDPSERVSFDLLKNTVVITKREEKPLLEFLKQVVEAIKKKILTPEVKEIVRKVAPRAVAASVILSILSLALGFNLFNILAYLLYILSLMLEKLGLKKKRKPWGVVYDAVTKKPVDLVIVRVYNKNTKKLLETRVTDKYGRFGFLVPPSEYYLTVTKAGYTYASKIVAPGTKQDDVYSNLYHGAAFAITKEKALINANVPIDPLKEGKVKTFKQTLKNILILTRVSIKKIIIPLLILSLFLAFLSYGVTKKPFDLFLVALVSLFLLKENRERRKQFSWGIVYDSETKKPIENAVVKIYDKEYDRLRETRLTDKFGRYGFLVPPGKYYLEVSKSNYQFPSKKITTKNDGKLTNIYHSETLDKTYADTLISTNIALDPEKK